MLLGGEEKDRKDGILVREGSGVDDEGMIAA